MITGTLFFIYLLERIINESEMLYLDRMSRLDHVGWL